MSFNYWPWWKFHHDRQQDYNEHVSSRSSTLSTAVLTFLFVVITISYYAWLINRLRRKHPVPLPPGPLALPLIGNLPFLDKDLHRCFAKLSKKYGPVMRLHLGTRLWIVLSSPSVAKEFLKDHDIIYATRDMLAVTQTGSYGRQDMVWAPYGNHWRMMRKLCVRELLSNARLDALYGLRQREVRSMVSRLYLNRGVPINVAEDVMLIMFNIVTSMLWGGTLEEGERARITMEFRQAMNKIVDILATPNVSDFFPALAKLDLQGIDRQVKKLISWFDQLFEYIIQQRRKMVPGEGEVSGNEKESSKDFLQVLLKIIDEANPKIPFNETHLKGLYLDMMGAGTETSSSTVEWAMAELMKHPEKLKKTQQELDQVVGTNNIVEESHLPKLHYLNAVLKEVLRLHPVAPLLVPRHASETCILGGYLVPEGAKVMVNAWAIQRDPEYWEEPLEFRPERFLAPSSEWDYNGKDFRYIPFGSGRRICVGIPMAERMIPYLLGTLLHSFEWELPEGVIEVDLSDCFGLELKKKVALVAIPKPRLSDPRLYD
ncbi:hypothetical protein Scep_006699 [Stephania cephalantha]|uniref:Cytochrome P450 n=1 Tax=Stephania cephalantha TaxID=152367 RepID=A0AAP0K8M9_9MAGN